MSLSLASILNEIRAALGESQISSPRLERLFERQRNASLESAKEQAYLAKLLLRNHEKTRFLNAHSERLAGRATSRTAAEEFARKLLDGSERGRAGMIDVAREYYKAIIGQADAVRAQRAGETGGVGSDESLVLSAEIGIDALNAELARLESIPYALNALGSQHLQSVDDLVTAWERIFAQRPDLSGHELIDNPEAMKALQQNDLILQGLEELIARDGARIEHLPEALAQRINREGAVDPGAQVHETRAPAEPEPLVAEFLANYQKDIGEFDGPALGRKKPDQPVDPQNIDELANNVTAELMGVSADDLAMGEVELPFELLSSVRSLAANNLDATNNNKDVAHDQLRSHLLKSEQFRPHLLKDLRTSVVLMTQLGRLPEDLRSELHKAAEGGPMSNALKSMIARGLEARAFPPEAHKTLQLSMQSGELSPSLRNALIRAAGKNLLPPSVLDAVKQRLKAPTQISSDTRNEIKQALTGGKIPQAYVPAFEKLLKEGRLDQAGRAAVQRGLSNKAFPPELSGVAQDTLDAGLPETLRASLNATVESDGAMPEQFRVGLLLSPHVARLPTNVREQLEVALTQGPVGKELGAQLEKLKSSKLPEGVLKQIDAAIQSGTLGRESKELKEALEFSRAAEELPWALRSALAESARPNGMGATQAFRLLSFLDKHGDDTAQAALSRMFKKNGDGMLPALSKDEVLNELMATVQRDFGSFAARQQLGQPVAQAAGPMASTQPGLNEELRKLQQRATGGYIR